MIITGIISYKRRNNRSNNQRKSVIITVIIRAIITIIITVLNHSDTAIFLEQTSKRPDLRLSEPDSNVQNDIWEDFPHEMIMSAIVGWYSTDMTLSPGLCIHVQYTRRHTVSQQLQAIFSWQSLPNFDGLSRKYTRVFRTLYRICPNLTARYVALDQNAVDHFHVIACQRCVLLSSK